MLRFSKKADYALIALSHLASRPGQPIVSAREVAEQHGIPGELLAKVLQQLVREGILTSVQGIKGGYRLARPADRMSIADVLAAIDGPLTLVACGDGPEDCDQFTRCTIRDPLDRVRARVASALGTCTIAELAGPVVDAPVAVFLRPSSGAASHAASGPGSQTTFGVER